MKPNEAPEKLYFGERDKGLLDIYSNRESNDDIEYIRTDPFIEKACSWLKSHYRDYMHNPTGNRLEAFFGGDMCNDFEDYMKGE